MTIETQEQLDQLLQSPEALNEYIEDKARLMAEKVVGDRVKQDVVDAITSTEVGKRLAMHEADEQNPNAEGASENGKFRSMGEFLKSVSDSQRPGMEFDVRLRALNESQGDQGGFLVPEEFRAELLSQTLETATIRPRARVIPMARETVRIPAVRDTTHASNVFGGVQMYWIPESGTFTSSEPTFSQVRLDAKKLTGLTRVTNEWLADSVIGGEGLITGMFASALAYFEDDAFINGSGAGQPVGLLNADALITVAKETGQTATTLVKENLDKMYARMLPTSRANAVWIANTDVIPQLLSLSQSVGTGGSAVMVANIANAPTFSIYGRPVLFTEKAQTLGTAGDIYFADLSYYLIGDRQSVTMASSMHTRFTTDETEFRVTSRLDGRPWIDSALTPRNGSNTLSPFINLAARS